MKRAMLVLLTAVAIGCGPSAEDTASSSEEGTGSEETAQTEPAPEAEDGADAILTRLAAAMTQRPEDWDEPTSLLIHPPWSA